MKRTGLAIVAMVLIPLIVLGGSFNQYKKDLMRGLRAKDVGQVAEAIRNLASLNSKKAVKFILAVALKADQFSANGFTDSDILKIHEAALDALKSVTDRRALEYMAKEVTRHRDWRVRVMLIDVLKDKDGDIVETALAKVLKSTKRQEVLLAALEAIRQKRFKKAVPALIDLLAKVKRKKGLVWIETRRALLALTGQDFETIEDWRKWWSTVSSYFDPKKETTVGAGRTVMRRKKRVPKLFGTEVVSKRVVFVLDVSGSMLRKDPEPGEGPGRTTTLPQPGGQGQANIPESRQRIRRAKNELIKVIKMLEPDVRFNLIAFSSNVRKWKDRGLYPATPANKASAIRWVQGLQANGTTCTDDALKAAFEFKEANTIYLLSDGSPTRDGRTPIPTDKICEMVRNLNKFRKVRIYTLGFIGANRPFMQQLASENYGKYSDIR